MLDGPLVFVDVDTQRDFMDPAGALYIAGCEAIVPNLSRLTRFARAHQVPILATACAHTPADAELEIFPPHCMLGTEGLHRIAATEWPGGFVLGLEDRLSGPLPPHLTLQKREFSLFSRPDTAEVLARYEEGRPTFVVYGVATDYCVRAAVLGLLDRRDRVAVVVDAIRAIDQDSEPEVLDGFVERGAFLTLTGTVCGP